MKNYNGVLKILNVLGLLFVLAGCSDLFIDKPAEPERKIPGGKGAVKWSIATEVGRTLFPTMPFSKYELEFTAAGKDTVRETLIENTGEILLETGPWTLSVTAFVGSNPVARGSAPVTVQGGRTNSVSIILKGDVTGSGSGTLNYEITLPAGLLYAELSVTALNGPYSTKVPLTASPTGSIPSIPDGYYLLAFSLFEATRRAVITDVAHIYNGLSTDGVYDLSAAFFVAAQEIAVPSGGAVIYINDAAGLAAIAGDIADPAKNNGKNTYILKWDIDLSAHGPWTPLGSAAAPFTGYLFGDGHTISGLELSGDTASGIGFFGKTLGSVIQNINVEIAGTTLALSGGAEQTAGVVAGYAENTVIRNVQLGAAGGVEFSVTKTGGGELYAGSFAGKISGTNSKIERSGAVFDIAVQSDGSAAYAGGLVGQHDGQISESFAIGRVTHTNAAAGAALYTAGLANGGTQENCYFNGNITATGANLRTAGLGGSAVSKSYAAGSIANNGPGAASGLSSGTTTTVSASAALNLAVGGFAASGVVSAGRIGAADSGTAYNNNIALGNMAVNGYPIADDAVNPANHKNGLGKTAVELKDQAVYSALGWDFAGVWKMVPDGYPYPVFKRQGETAPLPDDYGVVELPEDFTADFTSLTALDSYLAALPQNSAAGPYPVKLSGLDISAFENGTGTGTDPLGALFAALAGKYVSLDLSACTGTVIGSSTQSITISARPNKAMPVFILLPSALTEIGRQVFEGCSSLKSITIPDGVTAIRVEAFNNCTSLESVDLPSGLTTLAGFTGCTSLVSIEVPSGVAILSQFTGCTSLVSINIPSGVTTLFSDAFKDCSALASITIPAGITSIPNNAFQGCSSLETVSLPSGLTSIGDYAFRGCSSLKFIIIPETVTSIGVAGIFSGFAFSGCVSLESVSLPSGLTSIRQYTFDGCVKLASISIPASLTSIGISAFRNCSSLSSIEFPTVLAYIDNGAFQGCDSLASIISRAVTPPEAGNPRFDYTQIIQVPAASVSAYKAAAGWSQYESIISAIP
jgi:hypothetical protein